MTDRFETLTVHAWADVDQHARTSPLDKVPGARFAGVRGSGRSTENGQVHRSVPQRCSIGT
jgi:hypothetical protein